MDIIIENMNYEDMIKLTNIYRDGLDKINFDFNKLKFIEPAGAVVFLSFLDYLNDINQKITFTPLTTPKNNAVSYGCTMGIFQQLGLTDGPVYEEGDTYIAPKKIWINQIKMDEEKYFDNFSRNLTTRILPNIGNEDNTYLLFQYVIREIIRNVFDHSQSDSFYYGVQKYPKKDLIEVAISDLGIGLKETVPFDAEEIYYKKTTDIDAIHKAMLPGISNFSNHTYASEDFKNSGYGLTLIKKIIENCNGKLSIATGKASLTFSTSNNEEKIDCDLKGTIIRLQINIGMLESIKFNNILNSVQIDEKKDLSVASKSLKLSFNS